MLPLPVFYLKLPLKFLFRLSRGNCRGHFISDCSAVHLLSTYLHIFSIYQVSLEWLQCPSFQGHSDSVGRFPTVFLAHFPHVAVRILTQALLTSVSPQGLLVVTFAYCFRLTDSLTTHDTFFSSSVNLFPSA